MLFRTTCFAALLLVPAGAVAESAVPVFPDAGRPGECGCNDDCTGADVCTDTTFGYRRCCPSTMDGCPADPGAGFVCEIDAGTDAGPTVRMDAGPMGPMDAGAGGSPPVGSSGCSASAPDSGATLPALLVALGSILGLRRRRR